MRGLFVPEQRSVLEWVADHAFVAGAPGASNGQRLSTSMPLALLQRVANTPLAVWADDIDPALVERAGIVPGSKVRLSSEEARLVPEVISSNGSAIPMGTWEWVHGYRERAARLVRTATRAGTRVVWVGIPIVQQQPRWGFYRNVNEIYREMATSDPRSTYVDTWAPFQAKDGGYSAFVRNDRGQLVEVRAGDGVHFTPAGYAMLGKLALRGADEAFGMPQRAVGFRV